MIALAFAAVLGLADVPSPSPQVQADCTLDKQCKDGAVCPTLGGAIDADCAADKAQRKMVLKCQTPNPSVGKAIYCPAAKSGCGKSSVASSNMSDGRVAIAVGAMFLAGVALRRARSRRSPRR
jgi:hypothetical protein